MNGLTEVAGPEQILDRLAMLADGTRARLLVVLEGHEFTVGELCTVLQLPQSTVSRHLKLLADERWLTSVQDGTSRRYRMALAGLDDEARQLWALVRQQVAQLPASRQDALRARSVLAQRTTRSQEFFAEAATRWDEVRRDLFGERADLQAMLGLLDPEWSVGDLGCGTGRVSDSLAPFVRRVVSVDSSREMLTAARGRLQGHDNVEVREGSIESLPLDDGELDIAIVFLVLHYVVAPEHAFAEIARVLHPGGRLLVVDMTPHDRAQYQHDMGHAWLGFSRARIEGWMIGAGLDAPSYHELAPDPEASGPALFAATARRPA